MLAICSFLIGHDLKAQIPCDACHDPYPPHDIVPGYYIDNLSSSTFQYWLYESTIDAGSCAATGLTFYKKVGSSGCENWTYSGGSYQNITQIAFQELNGGTPCGPVFTMDIGNRNTGVITSCAGNPDWFANYGQCGVTDLCLKGILK